MTKIERIVRELSDMYDIWLTFRRARIAAGLPVESPIPEMTNEEFEELRQATHQRSGRTTPPSTNN